jgi:hypothetical protein
MGHQIRPHDSKNEEVAQEKDLSNEYGAEEFNGYQMPSNEKDFSQ